MGLYCLFRAYKSNTVFLIGFVIGVGLGILFCKTDNVSSKGTCMPQKRQVNNYNYWLNNKGIVRKPINYDSYVYGHQKIIPEASYLEEEVPVLCVVFVRKLRYAQAVKETWGKHCNSIEFIGMQNVVRSKEYNIPLVTFQPKNSFHFLCDSINYIVKKYQKVEWVLFTYDNMFVIVENLRYLVAPLNPFTPYYLGHPLIFWGQIYNVAEAGYVLSRAALHSLHTKFNSSLKCQTAGKYWKNEDFYLGKHLADLGIVPENTRDRNSFRFHGYDFHQLLFPGQLSRLSSYWKKSLHPYPTGFKCCSNKSVTFNAGMGDRLYLLNYFVQHVKIFTTPGYFGNKPPKLVSDDEIWKQVLLSEGIEEMNVTAKEYYELWLEKLPSPDTFNERIRQEHLKNSEISAFNFANMPHVLESMLSAMQMNETKVN